MTLSGMGKNAIEGKLHVVTFDLETRRLATDVGGWSNLKRGDGGISALVVFDSLSTRYHLYAEHPLVAAAQHLESADVVLSFNGQDFDVPVIEGILQRRLEIGVHVDLLQLVWAAVTGRRKGNKLDDIALRTLGYGKPHDGTLAPTLADEGRWAELFDYCLLDVELTKKLFAYAQENGAIINGMGELVELQLPAWFGGINLS
mgnify:CR=1 FL=1